MSVLRISALSDSMWNSSDIALRQKSRSVTAEDIASSWFHTFVSDLFETLYTTPSGVGLAAPQVGIQLRVVAIDINRDSKKPILLINPSYEPVGEEQEESSESCLSVPGVVGNVCRYKCVKVKYQDICGSYKMVDYTGFLAVVMQHEIDHVDGILYVDRMKPGDTVITDAGHPNKLAVRTIQRLIEKANQNETYEVEGKQT